MIGEMSLESFETLLEPFGGTVTYKAPSDDSPGKVPLYEHTWNHTTLQTLKVDRGVTYLQCLYPHDRLAEAVAQVGAKFEGEVMQHLEFLRINGTMTASGIPVIRYRSPERLYEIIAGYEACGIMIANPHVVTLEDGSRYKRVDADQLGFKHEVDPMGLLNPGKMRSFVPQRDMTVTVTPLKLVVRCRAEPKRRCRQRASAAAAPARRHLQDLRQRRHRARRRRSDDPARRVRQPARPVGLREIDAAQADRRASPRRPPAPSTGRNRPTMRSARRSRRSGFVFQEPTLLPWRTVADNVHLPLMLAGTGKRDAKERVDEVLELVGLSAFADSHPRQLSGGMKMRVSIARALVTRPKILLMDEPFAALDEITRIKLNDDLLELFARQGLTVIFVTHSVYELVYLSNRIVVMSSRPGRISADIPIEVRYPRNRGVSHLDALQRALPLRLGGAAARHERRRCRVMAALRHLVPKSIRAPFARYSHAVEVPAHARWLLCSGQLGISANDQIPESAEAQAVLCFEAIGACLAEARHVVRQHRSHQRLCHRSRAHGALHGGARPLRRAAAAGLDSDDRLGLHAARVQGRGRGHRGEG